MSLTEVGQYPSPAQVAELREQLRPILPKNLCEPGGIQRAPQVQIPLLERVATTEDRMALFDQAMTKIYNEIEVRLQRIESTLGLNR